VAFKKHTYNSNRNSNLKKTGMKSNSINNNGCSVCEQGKENYTTFRPAHRPKQTFYQYDYNTDGELFSTVAPTLEECRSRRNEWIAEKSKDKYILFLGFQRLGEFDTISEAKKYAQDSGLTGAFNLLGDNYRDAWYISQ
jgi:hypothetical protein